MMDEGTDSLIEAVDAGKVNVSTTADITDLDKHEQNEVIARGEVEILRAAQQIRQERKV